MKLTLRKANALQNAIQDHIKTIDVKNTISLNEFQDVQTELTCARETLLGADVRRDNLTKALFVMRKLVGRANVESGVADLLTDAAYIDKRLAQLKGLIESKASESTVVLEGKLEKLRSTEAKSRIYGYGDTVETGVLLEQVIDGFKSTTRELKKQKQTINDKVLELNVRTEIELDAQTVQLLQKEQLI